MESQSLQTQDTPLSYIKKVEGHIIKWLIGGIVSGIGLTVVFYFNTNSSLANHGEKIKEHDTRISKVEDSQSKINYQPEITAEQINSIKEMVVEIRDRQRATETRQDKMYDIIIELSKKK